MADQTDAPVSVQEATSQTAAVDPVPEEMFRNEFAAELLDSVPEAELAFREFVDLLWTAARREPLERIAELEGRVAVLDAGLSGVERHELEAYRDGLGQLAEDPPGLDSPRFAASAGPDSAIHLQVTHRGVPVWVCANLCGRVTVTAAPPGSCGGCGGQDSLSEALYPNVEFDNEDDIAAEYGPADPAARPTVTATAPEPPSESERVGEGSGDAPAGTQTVYPLKPATMYERAYCDVQEVLDEALGTEEEDGAGEGIAADVRLLAAQRDEARAEVERLTAEQQRADARIAGLLRLRDEERALHHELLWQHGIKPATGLRELPAGDSAEVAGA